MFYVNAGSVNGYYHMIHDSDHDCVYKHTVNRRYFPASDEVKDIKAAAVHAVSNPPCDAADCNKDCWVDLCDDCFYEERRREGRNLVRIAVRRSA